MRNRQFRRLLFSRRAGLGPSLLKGGGNAGKSLGGANEAAPEISARILTFRYVIALAILAMIAVASHVSFTRVLRENGGSTYLNVVSGQQQTAVQLIARYASQYADSDSAARDKLMRGIDQLATDHGVTQVRDDEAELMPALNRPDKALYAAKSAGRNQVAEFTGVEEPIPLADGRVRAG